MLHRRLLSGNGAGRSNARIGSLTIEPLTKNVGGQAMYAISMGWSVLSPFLRSEWVHEFKGDSRMVTASVGPTSVTVQTNNPDRDYFNLDAGASATFRAASRRSPTMMLSSAERTSPAIRLPGGPDRVLMSNSDIRNLGIAVRQV